MHWILRLQSTQDTLTVLLFSSRVPAMSNAAELKEKGGVHHFHAVPFIIYSVVPVMVTTILCP